MSAFWAERMGRVKSTLARPVATIAAVWGLLLSTGGPSIAAATDAYPLSPEMALLKRDAASVEFRAILKDMLITELAAEWKRAINADDATSFESTHGGKERIQADPALAAAYAEREKVTKDFLEVIRSEYARRKTPAPFDKGAKADRNAAGGAKASTISIADVHPQPDAASQWYRFRGPTGQGQALGKKLPPLRWSANENIRWKSRLPGVGNSSPILWNDAIYLGVSTPDGKRRGLVCLDRATGQIRWQDSLAVDPLEQSVREENGFASATPICDGEQVYAFFGNGGLLATSLKGERRWLTSLGKFDGMHGPGCSPILHGDLVLLVQDQNKGASVTVGLDRQTGAIRWRRDRPTAMGWCTPVVLRIGARDEMIFASNKRLYSLDPASGRDLWSIDGPTEEPVPSVIFGHGMIYSTSGRNGPTLAVRPGDASANVNDRVAWTSLRGGPHVPGPILLGDYLYLVNDRGILTCLEAKTGKTIYQNRLEGKFYASPASAGKHLFLTNEAGDTFVVEAGPKFKKVGVNSLGETVRASLAIVDGEIFARGQQTLFCIADPSAVQAVSAPSLTPGGSTP